MYRPKQETLLQKFNRTDPFKLLNKRNMQKGITKVVRWEDDLKKQYPERFGRKWQRSELEDDQYDPALYPERYIDEKDDGEIMELESGWNDNIKFANWYRDNK